MQPGNEVQREVPDITVRQYFIRADDPAKQREVQALVRRLQRMDVEVERLTAPLVRARLHALRARSRGRETLPAGTYVVSLGQRQKHWVQAMLNEDTYTPFPYFYDVTAWSQPLLFDVEGGYSGRALAMATAPVAALGRPGRRAAAGATALGRAVLDVAAVRRAASSPRAGCAGCSTTGGSTSAT